MNPLVSLLLYLEKDITRYDCTSYGEMEEDDYGDWLKREDVLACVRKIISPEIPNCGHIFRIEESEYGIFYFVDTKEVSKDEFYRLRGETFWGLEP